MTFNRAPGIEVFKSHTDYSCLSNPYIIAKVKSYGIIFRKILTNGLLNYDEGNSRLKIDTYFLA